MVCYNVFINSSIHFDGCAILCVQIFVQLIGARKNMAAAILGTKSQYFFLITLQILLCFFSCACFTVLLLYLDSYTFGDFVDFKLYWIFWIAFLSVIRLSYYLHLKEINYHYHHHVQGIGRTPCVWRIFWWKNSYLQVYTVMNKVYDYVVVFHVAFTIKYGVLIVFFRYGQPLNSSWHPTQSVRKYPDWTIPTEEVIWRSINVCNDIVGC